MDVEKEHLEIIQNILDSHLSNGSKVWLFGSRLKKAKKKYSDLDLAVEAPNKLSLSTLALLAHDFSESDLPYKVDIVDINDVENNFLQNIKSEMKIFFQK